MALYYHILLSTTIFQALAPRACPAKPKNKKHPKIIDKVKT